MDPLIQGRQQKDAHYHVRLSAACPGSREVGWGGVGAPSYQLWGHPASGPSAALKNYQPFSFKGPSATDSEFLLSVRNMRVSQVQLDASSHWLPGMQAAKPACLAVFDCWLIIILKKDISCGFQRGSWIQKSMFDSLDLGPC